MFWTCIQKDLLRARRKPGAYLAMMILPIAITAVMGMVFGGGGKNSPLPRVPLVLIDNDRGLVSQFLLASFQQKRVAELIELRQLERAEAERQLLEGDLSAMLVIPAGFSAAYLEGGTPPELELVTNPGQNFLPAIVETMARFFVDGLNQLALNCGSTPGALLEELSDESGQLKPDKLKELVILLGFQADDSLQISADMELSGVEPGLKLSESAKPHRSGEKEQDLGRGGIFGMFLGGTAAFFLLFLASTSAGDLHQELEQGTLTRFRTLHFELMPWVFSKVGATIAVVFCAELLLFGGGILIFKIPIQRFELLLALTLGFAFFSGGLLNLLTNLWSRAETARMVNQFAIFGMGFFGGGMIPGPVLPASIREHISPLLPNYWFGESFLALVENREIGYAVPLKLALLGLFFAFAAALILGKKLRKGAK